MNEYVKFERDSIMVDGVYIATATVIQDDDGDLWAVVAVSRIDVITEADIEATEA